MVRPSVFNGFPVQEYLLAGVAAVAGGADPAADAVAAAVLWLIYATAKVKITKNN